MVFKETKTYQYFENDRTIGLRVKIAGMGKHRIVFIPRRFHLKFSVGDSVILEKQK